MLVDHNCLPVQKSYSQNPTSKTGFPNLLFSSLKCTKVIFEKTIFIDFLWFMYFKKGIEKRHSSRRETFFSSTFQTPYVYFAKSAIMLSWSPLPFLPNIMYLKMETIVQIAGRLFSKICSHCQ